MKWLRRILSKEKKMPVVKSESQQECVASTKGDVVPQELGIVLESFEIPDTISEGRSVPGVSSTNAGAGASMAQHQGTISDQPAKTGIREGVDSVPDKHGPESGKVDGQVLSAKHAAENPPSSFPDAEPDFEPDLEPEIMIGIEPRPNDDKFKKRHPDEEPPLRPRKEWEKWYKRQGNSGSETHVEWKRRTKEAGIQIGEL